MFLPPLITFSIIFFFGDWLLLEREGPLLLMGKAFEVVDRFMEYRVYKIRKMLGLELIREYPQMTGNGHSLEKTRYGKLELHSLCSDLESEIFIIHEASKRVTFISHVVSGCLAGYWSVRGSKG